MANLPVCSYSDKESLNWLSDWYDHEVTFLGLNWSRCPFCSSKMRSRSDEEEIHVLADCETCGFWRVVNLKRTGGFKNATEVPAWRGVAKQYEVEALDVPLADLRRFLRRHPTHLAHVNPVVFEELIAECLKSAFPNSELVKVGGNRDRGIDLMLFNTFGEKYLVQIKRRSNIDRNEGVEVVRQLNGVVFRENAAKGLVVTTARNYTRDAIQETWVKSDNGIWQSIDLLGYEDITKWLNLPSHMPYEPWKTITRGAELSKTLF